MNRLSRTGWLLLLFLLFLLILLPIVIISNQQQKSLLSKAKEIEQDKTSKGCDSKLSYFPQNSDILRDKNALELYRKIKCITQQLLELQDAYETLQNETEIKNILIDERKTLVTNRKNLMEEAIKSYPLVFLENVLSLNTIARFGEEFSSYFESPISIEQGELQVMHIDNFENPAQSRFDYYIQTKTDLSLRYGFYPVGDFPNLISGSILKIRGYKMGNAISAQIPPRKSGGAPVRVPSASVTPRQQGFFKFDLVPQTYAQENAEQTSIEILKEASPDATGPQRVAVILVRSKGSTFIPYYSKEQIEDIIFRGDVLNFFKETSYGKMWLDEEKSKVYGWYELENLNVDPWDDVSNTSSTEFIKLADSDIDFSQFDRVMVGGAVDNNTSGGWADTVGKFTYSTSDGDILISLGVFGIGSNMSFVFAHELGHNLGVYHANSWECDQGGLHGNCIHNEYGNTFDVMGASFALRHFNAYFKEVFQWLNKSIINISSSGRYTLQPLESSDAVVAKIYRPGISNFPTYYLETRASISNGIHINWVNQALTTRLLTLVPIDAKGGVPEPLRRGQSFQDEKASLTITNIDDRTIDVEFKEPICVDDNFVVEKGAYIYAYVPGFYGLYEDISCDNDLCILKRTHRTNNLELTFPLFIKNNNPYACPVRHIRVMIDDPWKKDVEDQKWEAVVAGGDTFYTSSYSLIPPMVPDGIYTITARIEDIDTHQILWSDSRKLYIKNVKSLLEGDVNNDGEVDFSDITYVSQVLVGKNVENLTVDMNNNGKIDIGDSVLMLKAADVNNNGEVDVGDLVLMLKMWKSGK
ncbi:MAG TPA: dockerin type I domain-containing protein [Patescibacteria group bacterium]|nr:dockerin type I domain-containing protein [Patescibacteria group bacterium]